MSPKNKGKFGKGKTEVPVTDEFQSKGQELLDRLRPYAMRITVMMTIIVVGFIGFITYRWWTDRKEREATSLYFQAADLARRQVVPKDESDTDKGDDDDDSANQPEKPPTFDSIDDQANAELAAVKKLDSEAGGTHVATQGDMVEARALLDTGKYDEAEGLYRAYVKHAPNDVVKTIAREGIGYALEAKAMAQTDPSARQAGLKAALEAFKQMQPEEKGPRWLYALYHEARLSATLGDNARAAELYQKILDSEPTTDVESLATARLAMLGAPAAKAPPAVPGNGAGKDDSGKGASPAGDDGAGATGGTDD